MTIRKSAQPLRRQDHRIRRRELIRLLGASLVAFPCPAEAETPIARVAVLREFPPSNPQVAQSWQIFVEELQKSGWIEGRNVEFIHRAAEGRTERYRELADELVAIKPSVIITVGSATTEAVRQKTQTIPIVMIGVGDPVGAGFIGSLARPGGNITGVSDQLPDTIGKLLQIAKELRPSTSRVAFFWRPDNPATRIGKQNIEAAAPRLALTVEANSVTTDAELDAALSAMALAPPDALVVPPIPPMSVRIREIADFAIEHRLPTLANNPTMVRAGLLISLAPPVADVIRRAAALVAKILNGTKPADIPVEQPTSFELVINLKTAKALGLTVPPSILARADEVIE
jgi:putative ABC transport system substrate-binding protein